MTEYILSINFNIFISFFIMAFICQFIFCRKTLFSLLDPLNIYIINNSFSIAFVFYLFMDGEIVNEAYLFSFIACNVAFFTGINTVTARFKKTKLGRITTSQKKEIECIKVSRLLNTLLYMIVGITILANIFLILQTGELPLLSNNADSAKVALRQDGLGIVFRVNDVLLPLGITIVLFKIFPPTPVVKPTKVSHLTLVFLLTILILIFISGGSKGALISLLGIFIPCQFFNKYFKSQHLIIIDRIVLLILPTGALLVFYILLKSFNDVKELDPFQALMVRLVANGDAFYYFYKYDLIKKFDLNFFNYIADTLNPLLSMLKITSYDTAFGEKLLIESINLTTGGFGPNSPHPVYGLMYFGFIGSCLFSFVIGVTTSLIRTKFLAWTLKTPNQLNMIIYTICFYHIPKLSTDYTSFLSAIYASVSIVIPVFIFSKLFTIDRIYTNPKP